MQVADHFSAVKRRFESRAMPAYEKPPAKLVDIYFSGAKEDRTPDPLLAKQVLSQLSYNPNTS